MNAANFDDEEMSEAIAFAHRRGVKVYVTVNTLLRDDELRPALIYAEKLSAFGADALIIQDVGFGSLVRRFIPELPIHFSTQGSVYGPEGVKFAASLGYSRVVLARELTLNEIREACKVGPEIEVFCHGALCICYSGQCQMSRAIGGRSGNRGMCAQPCRLPYRTGSGEEYLLSPADLCLADRIGSLAEAGVASIKIEGRMKSPEYVSVVTSVYRKYLDEYASGGRRRAIGESDRLALAQIFSRGFTEAYFSGKADGSYMSGDVPKNKGVRVGTVTSGNAGRSLIEIRPVSEGPADGTKRDHGRVSGSSYAPPLKISAGDVVEIRAAHADRAGEGGRFGKAARGVGNADAFKVTYLERLPNGCLRIGDAKEIPARGDEIFRIVSAEQMKAASESYTGKDWNSGKFTRKIPLNAVFEAGRDGRVSLTLTTDDFEHTASAFAGPFAAAGPGSGDAAENRAARSLEKTGGTPYIIENISFAGPFAISAPMSAFNELRRNALSAMDDALAGRRPTRSPGEIPAVLSGAGTPAALSSAGAPTALSGAGAEAYDPAIELYFLDTDAFKDGTDSVSEAVTRILTREIEDAITNSGVTVRAVVPAACAAELAGGLIGFAGKERHGFAFYTSQISEGREDELIRKDLKEIVSLAQQGHGIYVGNAEWLAVMAGSTADVYADFGMNIFNSASEDVFRSLGACGFVRSLEGLQNSDGPFPLMISRHAFDEKTFTDRKGVGYRVIPRAWSDQSVIVRDELPDFCRLADFALKTGTMKRAYVFC